MALQSLKLENYRNFNLKEFEFTQNTAIIGKNGTGKSNLIEAIRLLSVGKSFRSSRADDLVALDHRSFRLDAKLKQEKKCLVSLFYGYQFEDSTIKERRLTLNEKDISWNEFWGIFPTVIFTPTDIAIVTDSPQLRRKFIDGILWQVDKEFRLDLVELGRVLRERSALLWMIKVKRVGIGELEPWNELLSNLTEKIRTKRIECVDTLLKHIRQMGELATKIDLKYRFSLERIGDQVNEEIAGAQNLFGPHRDELEISFDSLVARRFSSRGQARSVVVILKAAEVALIKDRLGVNPTILLDDILSELDEDNARFLFQLFQNSYQVIFTSITKPEIEFDYQVIEL